jgi:hypothetical protein
LAEATRFATVRVVGVAERWAAGEPAKERVRETRPDELITGAAGRRSACGRLACICSHEQSSRHTRR